MRRIKELVIVEGKHDTANLQRYFDVTTLETGGTHVRKEFLQQLKELTKMHKLIILTDPDSWGNQIRKTISKEIEDCDHAYLTSDRCRYKDRVGVQYADEQALIDAFDNVVTYGAVEGSLTIGDLAELGLTGGTLAKARRRLVSCRLHIGDANAKTFLKRINAVGCDKTRLKELLRNG